MAARVDTHVVLRPAAVPMGVVPKDAATHLVGGTVLRAVTRRALHPLAPEVARVLRILRTFRPTPHRVVVPAARLARAAGEAAGGAALHAHETRSASGPGDSRRSSASGWPRATGTSCARDSSSGGLALRELVAGAPWQHDEPQQAHEKDGRTASRGPWGASGRTTPCPAASIKERRGERRGAPIGPPPAAARQSAGCNRHLVAPTGAASVGNPGTGAASGGEPSS